MNDISKKYYERLWLQNIKEKTDLEKLRDVLDNPGKGLVKFLMGNYNHLFDFNERKK